MTLSDAELERYARQIVLREVGGVGQKKLKAAKVAVIGAGGIGNAVITALAGAGIGRLTIIDDDAVELANLHRQPLFGEVDAGQPKAELAAQFVARLNHHVDVSGVSERVDFGNAERLLAGYDLVIDGSDNFATRLTVSDACVRLGTSLISAAAIQFQGQVGLFRGRPCYRCFVGEAFDAEDCDNCAELGVLGALTGTMGNFAALLAINTIVGIGEDTGGKVHLFDGSALSLRAISIPADRHCKACG